MYMASSVRVVYYRIYQTVESWDSEQPTQVSADVITSVATDELIVRTLPVVDTHTACTLTARQQRLLSSHPGHSLLLCCHLQKQPVPRH